MPDKIESLYSVLKNDPNYSNAKTLKDLNTFKTSFGSPESMDKLYGVLKNDPNYATAKTLSSPDIFKSSFLTIPKQKPVNPITTGALNTNAYAAENLFNKTSDKPLNKGYQFDPAHVQMLSKGVNPFSLNPDNPGDMDFYKQSSLEAKQKEEARSKLTFKEQQIEIENDVKNINEYYSAKQNTFKIYQDVNPDNYPIKFPNKYNTVANTNPLNTKKEELGDLQKQQADIIQAIQDKRAFQIMQESSIVKNPKLAIEKNIQNPAAKENHYVELGIRTSYPLDLKKQEELLTSYNTKVSDFEKRISSLGFGLGEKIMSPTEIGIYATKGKEIEKSFAKNDIANLDLQYKGTKDNEGLITIKDEYKKYEVEIKKKLIENPELKNDKNFNSHLIKFNEDYNKLNNSIVENRNEKALKEQYLNSVDKELSSVLAPYEKLQKQSKEYAENQPTSFMEALSLTKKNIFYRVAESLPLFTINTLGGAGAMLLRGRAELSGVSEDDKKLLARGIESYSNNLRSVIGAPDTETSRRSEFASLKEDGTLDLNWAALPLFIVQTCLESMAMGGTGVKLASVLGKAKSLSPILGRAGTVIGEVGGMAIAAEAMFGTEMLKSELDKGLDYNTANKVHYFRIGLEALSEMLNLLELKIARGGEDAILKMATDDAESILFRTRHIKEYMFNKTGTHKWDDAVDWLYRSGNSVKRFGLDGTKNGFGEYFEEFASNVGNFVGDNIIKNKIDPNYKGDNEMSFQNEKLTFINTVMGMGIMIGQSGYQKHKATINAAEYQIGDNPQVYLDRLEQDYKDGYVSQPQYVAQKSRIEKLKQVGILSTDGINIIDSVDIDATTKDNLKLTVFNQTKEIYEIGQKIQDLKNTTGSDSKIDKLSKKIVDLTEERTKLISDIEKHSPVYQKEQLEINRVARLNKILDNNFSLYEINKIQKPSELEDHIETIQEQLDLENKKETPNPEIVGKLEGIITNINERLSFIIPETEEVIAETDSNNDGLLNSIVNKFLSSDTNATLSDEEEEFLTNNQELVQQKVDEVTLEKPTIKVGDAEIFHSGVKLKGKITKVYNNGNLFDFEHINPEGKTVYYNALDKDSLTETPSESLSDKYYGNYTVSPSKDGFEVINTETGSIEDIADTHEEAVVKAKQLHKNSTARVSDFLPEQEIIVKPELVPEVPESLSENEEDINSENQRVLALPSYGTEDTITYVGKKLVDGFVSIANKMREFAEITVNKIRSKQPISDDLDQKYTFLLSPNKITPGTRIKFIVDNNPVFLDDSKEEFRELVNRDSLFEPYLDRNDISNDNYHHPIRIENEEGELLGYVHTLSYITPSNVASSLDESDVDSKENLEKNYRELKSLRDKIMKSYKDSPDNIIYSTVIGKSAGHLSLAARDEKGNNVYLPVKERFKNNDIIQSIQINTGDEIIKNGLVVQNRIANGRPIAILPMPNGKFMAAGLKRTNLTKEVAQSIRYAIELYRNRDLRKEEIEDILKNQEDKSLYDLSSIDGLSNYINSFVHTTSNRKQFVTIENRINLSNIPFIDFDRGDGTIWFSGNRAFWKDTPENLFGLEGDEKTADLKLNAVGIFRIKLDKNFDASSMLDQLEKVIESMNMNVSKEMLSKPDYESLKVDIPIIEKIGKSYTLKANPDFETTGKNYKDFLAKHLSTNILEHEITVNGKKEFSYFEQPTITFSPDISVDIKTKGEVLEQPKENIIKAFQGRKEEALENRSFEYFTLDKDETKAYGDILREEELDLSNFLFQILDSEDIAGKSNDEYWNLFEEFKKENGKYFDILDNSEEGLQVQNKFFEFLKTKGYSGFSTYHPNYINKFVSKNVKDFDNTYIVVFNKTEDKIEVTEEIPIFEEDLGDLMEDFDIDINETKEENPDVNKEDTNDLNDKCK